MATTASTDLLLLDTSIWIEYFRKRDPVFSEVESLIEEGRVCTAHFVVAEILQGARTDLEFATLQEAVHIFCLLEEFPDTWMEAARLSSRLRRRGQSVGLGDCYIATLALQHRTTLWSLDRHFQSIRRILPLTLKIARTSGKEKAC